MMKLILSRVRGERGIRVKGSTAALLIFVAIFGFSMGGIMSTFPIIVAALFGRKSFTNVIRYISIFLILQVFGYVIALILGHYV